MTNAMNLVELLQTSCDRYPDRPVLGTRQSDAWRWLSYRELGDLVDRARAGLAALGVGPGDRVAIVGNNSVEWAVAAYATYGLGAAFVPMYQAQRPREWQFILRDCSARVVFAATDAIYDALHTVRAELPDLAHIIGLSRPGDAPASWHGMLTAGAAAAVPARSPDPDTIASYIYTSGTTGDPKGVLLSHANMIANINASNAVFSFRPDDRTLSFLPWAHVFGQMCDLHMTISYGGSTAINNELPRLFQNLVEVKPTIFVAVPRVLNRFYDIIRSELADRPDLLQDMAHEAVAGGRAPQRPAPTERLFRKIRDHFGGRLRYVFCGSAALHPDVARTVDAVGIDVFEGYGLTETSPTVTTNWPGNRRFGSVGRVVPGVRVVIEQVASKGEDKAAIEGEIEGEIVVYGPNVMVGYHCRPGEQAATVLADGGLRTGDLGRFDADGFLYITGRIKEQYKLENGKYVMPAPVEEMLKRSPFIANAMIYGDGRPYNVALIVPEHAAIRAWANRQGTTLADDLFVDPRVRRLIQAELERVGAELKSFERPRDFGLLREDFTMDNGLLTPTLKLKRRDIVVRYRVPLEELYPARRGSVHRLDVATAP
jgi:long-chain acyl-CoA synthetase